MEKTKEIDILKVLLILVKHKKFIFWTTLVVSIVAVVFSLVSPEKWTSTATILPAQENRNQLSIGGSSILGGLSSSLLGGTIQTSGSDLLILLNSRFFSEDVIDNFHLIEYMKIDNEDSLVVRELALETFTEEIRKIGVNEENGLIYISIETKDKFLSMDIANYYCTKLEEYNLNNRMTKGRQKRIFLEKRVMEVRATVDSLSKELMYFQKNNNIIELEQQTSEIVKLYANLIAQKTTKEIELEFSEHNNINNPVVEQLLLENEILSNKISDLEIKKDSTKKYILSMDELPEIALHYANIMMNLEIQETIFSFIYPQYEQAKIEEIKDLPTIEVIDRAKAAGLRSKPHRAKFCIISFILAVMISSGFSYIFEIFQEPNVMKKLEQIKKELFK